jgi:hypothetical protein
MQAVALLALFLSMPSARSLAPKVVGVWSLNHEKSDSGGLSLPQQLVLNVEQADQSLRIWEVTTLAASQSISYRQATLDPARCVDLTGSRGMPERICRIPSLAGMGDETWELSNLGELIIIRKTRAGTQMIRQRLVLEPSLENPN